MLDWTIYVGIAAVLLFFIRSVLPVKGLRQLLPAFNLKTTKR